MTTGRLPPCTLLPFFIGKYAYQISMRCGAIASLLPAGVKIAGAFQHPALPMVSAYQKMQ